MVESHEHASLLLRANLLSLKLLISVSNLSISFAESTHVLLLGICPAWSLQSCSLLLCLDIRNASSSNVLKEIKNEKQKGIFTSEAILATDFAKYLNTEAQQTTKHPASSNCLHADESGCMTVQFM